VSAAKHTPNPVRLVEGRFGRLLEEANREFVGGLDQHAALLRVTERLSTGRAPCPRRAFWLVPATVGVLATFVALPMILRRLQAETAPALVAEDLRAFRSQPAGAASAASSLARAEPAPLPRSETLGPKRESGAKPNVPGVASPLAASSDRRSAAGSGAESVEPLSAARPNTSAAGGPNAAPPAASADTGTAADCLGLARSGQTRDAESCFLKRAQGTGLSAEMALYEVARLRRDVLADAPGALAALAEYRTRFPGGSLRREVDMSQLELLLQLGRSDEALKQSDQLLSSSSSGERAAELHLLRGHILRKAQSRFADAEHEYALAESAGARGGDLSYFRALCLEALGRAPEAAALYAQYLEQPQRPYAEDARRRLERLKP